eukprot:1225567-Alexandrium_andersonii.AAC.1
MRCRAQRSKEVPTQTLVAAMRVTANFGLRWTPHATVSTATRLSLHHGLQRPPATRVAGRYSG